MKHSREMIHLVAQKAAEETNSTFAENEPLFIRTITHHFTGRLKRISTCHGHSFLHLSDAAWIPDDGRFHDLLAKGIPNEVEPIIGECRLNMAHILDIYTWDHALPDKQK